MPQQFVHKILNRSQDHAAAFDIAIVPKSTSAVRPNRIPSCHRAFTRSSNGHNALPASYLEQRDSVTLVLNKDTPHRKRSLCVSALAYVDSKPQQLTPNNPADLEDSLDPEAEDRGSASQVGFCVVNFYHLTELGQPHAAIASHRRWLQDKDIKGRIYISSQGINAQLSGPEADAHAYATWVSEQEGFQVCLLGPNQIKFRKMHPADSHTAVVSHAHFLWRILQ